MLIGKTTPLTGPQLRSKLGKPSATRDNKTDWHWTVDLPGGARLEIYNYKDGPTYGGNLGFEARLRWHIGAITGRTSTLIEQSRLLEELETVLGKGTCTYPATVEDLQKTKDLPF